MSITKKLMGGSQMFTFSKRNRTIDTMTSWLCNLAPFAALCDDSLKIVASGAYRTTRPAGTQLTRQGTYGHEAFVIVSGQVEVKRDGAHVETLGPGDFLGEMAMVGEPHRVADAFVTEQVEIAVWDRRAFLDVLRFVPPVDQLVRRTALARAA